MKTAFVYILSSRRNGTLYVGVTTDLPRRMFEHRAGCMPGFTQKYRVHRLVYYESVDDILSAITREKQIKKWNRQWKISLIEKHNPAWRDLYTDIL